jgi:3'(2'), 5'-bisphosphate nucleotidase
VDAYRTAALAAASIAFEAGQFLLTVRDRSVETGVTKAGVAADVEANNLILRRIAEEFPDDAILSEESTDTPARLTADRVWIIDPLDGTREYNIGGRVDWAVHVALYAEGRLAAGAVTLPAQGVICSTLAPYPRPNEANGIRMVVSRSRPPRAAQAVADALDAELIPMGSAGAKALAVVRGEADAYVHSGGQWEWDSAAPIAVANATGLFTSRIDGSEFVWNQEHPYQPDLVICRPDLAEPILAAIAAAKTP